VYFFNLAKTMENQLTRTNGKKKKTLILSFAVMFLGKDNVVKDFTVQCTLIKG
jgi:hypothetical protein